MNNDINEVEDQTSNPILDIVASIQSKLNESNTEEVNTPKQNKTTDFSGLDISKIVNMLNTNASKNNTNAENKISSPPLGGFDLNSIMKFQNVLSGMNSPDPRQNLLSSLKPFLRENRQKNIDTYISLLGVMKAFNLFNGKDRD